jgi:hypothetical protein
MDDIYNLLIPTSGTIYHSQLVRQAGPSYEFGFGIKVVCALYEDTAASLGLSFRSADGVGFPAMPVGYFSQTWEVPAAGSQTISTAALTTNSTPYDLTIDASAAGATFAATNTTAAGLRNVVVVGSGVDFSGSIIGPDTISLDNCLVSVTVDTPAAAVDIDSVLTAGSSVTVTNPVGNALQFNTEPLDHSLTVYSVPAGDTVMMSGTTAGTFNLGGLELSGGVTLARIDTDDSNNITVQVGTGIAVAESPTTGGGVVTVSSPPIAIHVIAPNILDLSQARLVINGLENENVPIAGGTGYLKNIVAGVDYTIGDELILLAAYQQAGVAKEIWRGSAVATTTDIVFNDPQKDWANPNVLGIDGSLRTEFETNYITVEVEVDDPDDTTEKAGLAAFMVNAITTEEGLRNWVALDGTPVIEYPTSTSALIDVTIASVAVNNVKAASTLSVKDAFSFDWSDGIDQAGAILGASIIWVNPDQVLLQNVGSGPLLPSEKIQLAQASEAQLVNEKIATPAVSVSADILAVKSVVDLGATQSSVDAIDDDLAVVDAKTDTIIIDVAAVSADIGNLADFNPSAVLEAGLSYDAIWRVGAAITGTGNFIVTPTTAVARDIDNTKNRASFTVDGNGNRIVVAIDGT